MRNLVLTLVTLAALVAASATGFYLTRRDPVLREAAREDDAMAWLRTEFKLTPGQEAEIVALQSEYALVCADHCALIVGARLRAAPPEEQALLEADCVAAMREHFRQVAERMSPEQGERYLAIVLPRIGNYPHLGAPNVEARP